jgi:hypothetical protein
MNDVERVLRKVTQELQKVIRDEVVKELDYIIASRQPKKPKTVKAEEPVKTAKPSKKSKKR